MATARGARHRCTMVPVRSLITTRGADRIDVHVTQFARSSTACLEVSGALSSIEPPSSAWPVFPEAFRAFQTFWAVPNRCAQASVTCSWPNSGFDFALDQGARGHATGGVTFSAPSCPSAARGKSRPRRALPAHRVRSCGLRRAGESGPTRRAQDLALPMEDTVTSSAAFAHERGDVASRSRPPRCAGALAWRPLNAKRRINARKDCCAKAR